jgi:hypothetical protein
MPLCKESNYKPFHRIAATMLQGGNIVPKPSPEAARWPAFAPNQGIVRAICLAGGRHSDV